MTKHICAVGQMDQAALLALLTRKQAILGVLCVLAA
jgi:hypothetical protein